MPALSARRSVEAAPQHVTSGALALAPSPSPAPGDARNEDIFAPQRSSSAALPDPEPLLINLTRSVLEILAGARDLEQIGRWVTEDVYATLLKRTVLAARARAVKRQPTQRPIINIARVIVSEPADGIVEAVVIVHTRARTRAVAVRLEGLDRRWRASAISVL